MPRAVWLTSRPPGKETRNTVSGDLAFAHWSLAHRTALTIERSWRRHVRLRHGARRGCGLRPASGAVGADTGSWRLTAGTPMHSGLLTQEHKPWQLNPGPLTSTSQP